MNGLKTKHSLYHEAWDEGYDVGDGVLHGASLGMQVDVPEHGAVH